MPIGKMDILITIENPTFTQDATTGQMVPGYVTWERAWAEKINKQTIEGEKTSQISSVDEEIFRIRYIPGLTKKMSIYDVELSRYYDITGISMEGRKAFLVITAKSFNVNQPV